MRLVAGETAYSGRGWRELAELVSQDGEFPFEELPEDVLVRLYEQGRWWNWPTWKRPGVIRLREMITCGGLPYVVYQAFSEENLDAGHGDVSLVDYLGGQCSETRSGRGIYMDQRGGLIEGRGHFSDGDCLFACSKLASMIRSEHICRERLPPSLLAVASRAYARASASFFRTELYVNRGELRGPGATFLPVYRVVGPGRVFVLSAEVPEVLRRAGIKLRRERWMGVPCVGGKFFSDLMDLWSSSVVLHGFEETVAARDGSGKAKDLGALLAYLGNPERTGDEVRREFSSGKFIVVRDGELDDGGDEVMRRVTVTVTGGGR